LENAQKPAGAHSDYDAKMRGIQSQADMFRPEYKELEFLEFDIQLHWRCIEPHERFLPAAGGGLPLYHGSREQPLPSTGAPARHAGIAPDHEVLAHEPLAAPATVLWNGDLDADLSAIAQLAVRPHGPDQRPEGKQAHKLTLSSERRRVCTQILGKLLKCPEQLSRELHRRISA
jgi:hypothetical protein